MNIVRRFLTANRSYKKPKLLIPKGIMIHSTGCPGVNADRWFVKWNTVLASKSTHAMIDENGITQFLPTNIQGWHCGKSGNQTHLSMEICEPKPFPGDKAYFEQVWKDAVALTVTWCKEFKLTEKDVLGHYEGYKKGIASNHSDPGHWFPKMGKSMNHFRADVKAALEEKPVAPKPVKTHYVRKGESLARIAKLYNLSWQTLAKINGLKLPYILRVGQVLKVEG
jgi:N-acetylmuramoyl-L-alanine amidase CwlA